MADENSQKQTPVTDSVVSNTDTSTATKTKTQAPSNKTKKSHLGFIKKLFGHKKLLVSLAVIFLIIGAVVFYFTRPERVVIKVGDKAITRGEVNQREGKLKSFYDFFGDSISEEDMQGRALDSLIMYYALTQEAEKRNLSVTDEELKAVFEENAKKHNAPVPEFESIMANTYGFDRQDLEINFKTQILKKKLAEHMLDYRNVLSVLVRYDQHEKEGGGLDDKTAQEIQQKLRSEFLPLMAQGVPTDQIIAKTDYHGDSEGQKSTAKYPSIGVLDENLNKVAKPDQFSDKSEWDVINGLKDVGDYTKEVMKSSGGYYYIYRLEKKTGGQFSTWEDFLKHVKDNASDYGLISNIKKALPSFALSKAGALGSCKIPEGSENKDTKKNLWNRIFGAFLPQKAYAQCSGNSSNHLTGWTGYVTTTGGISPDGVRVDVGLRPGAPSVFCGGYSSGSHWTAWNGYYSTGQNYSCYTQWKAVYSKANCQNAERDLIMTSGDNGRMHGGDQNITLTCEDPIKPFNVQGYKTYGDGVGSAFPGGQGNVYAAAGGTTNNPYGFYGLRSGQYISADWNITSGGKIYDIDGYTICYNNSGCHGGWRNWGNSVYIDMTASGGYADLYFHYKERDIMPDYSISADCNNINVSNLRDPNRSGDNVYFEIWIDGTNRFQRWWNGSFSEQIPIDKFDGNWHSVEGRAFNIRPDGSTDYWSYTYKSASFAYCDQAPTFSITADCTTITIYNLSDPNHWGNIPIEIDVDGQAVAVPSPNRGTFSVSYPSNKQDAGFHTVNARAKSIKRDGSTNNDLVTSRSTSVSNCFSANCQSSSTSSLSPSTSVYYAQGTVRSDATFRNTGQLSWNSGGRVTSRSIQNGSPVHNLSVPPTSSGGTASITYSPFTTPGTLNNQGIAMEIVLDGNTVLGTCFQNYDPWTHFQFTPTVTTEELYPDEERPTEFRMRTNVQVQFIEAPSSPSAFPTPSHNRLRATLTVMKDPAGGPALLIPTSTTTSIDRPPYNLPGVALPTGGNLVHNITDWTAGDRYCGRINLAATQGRVNRFGNTAEEISPSTTDGICKKVGNRPYIKIYGNDVMAGGSFGPSCTPVTAGRIHTYARYNSATSTYSGSSVQHAAFALGTITEFASASLRNSGTPRPHVGLSFSNTANVSGTSISSAGGQYQDASTCLPNYFGHKTGATTVPTAGSLSSSLSTASAPNEFDKYEYTGGSTLSLGGLSIPNAARKVVFHEGTVVITGNITYAGAGGWPTKADIPALYIVANQIIIGSNVTRLDGVYISQPGPGGSGVIQTCDDNAASFNTCRNQLTITGAFIAKKINFYRTYGTLRDSENIFKERPVPSSANTCEASNGSDPVDHTANGTGQSSTVGVCAGEVFTFSPETYLAPTPFTNGGGVGKYDSFGGLAPIL